MSAAGKGAKTQVNEQNEMMPLHPGQLWVLRIGAGAAALLLLAAVLVADVAWRPLDMLAPGIASAAAAALLIAWAIWIPLRRYRSWGYRLVEDELHIRSGLWVRSHTIVPFSRVQHIDVTQGPLERRFGVSTLVLHTAGTRNSAVALPGLGVDEAGRIRDIIRGKIRQDLV
jgi:membrane protein YdbS with pleckstrin-like domain